VNTSNKSISHIIPKFVSHIDVNSQSLKLSFEHPPWLGGFACCGGGAEVVGRPGGACIVLQRTAKRAFVQRHVLLQWPPEMDRDCVEDPDEGIRVVRQQQTQGNKHHCEDEKRFLEKLGHCRKGMSVTRWIGIEEVKVLKEDLKLTLCQLSLPPQRNALALTFPALPLDDAVDVHEEDTGDLVFEIALVGLEVVDVQLQAVSRPAVGD
jgi:hypothetical protein